MLFRSGATASTNGIVGYIPAPPAGTQNSYLRGDGTWQQANNGPTTAIAMHVAYITAPTGISTTVGLAFPFNTVTFSTGTTGVITPNLSNNATFVLAAGNTYKCTAQVGFNSSTTDLMYQWSTVPYVAGTTTLFGVIGDMVSGSSRSPTAIGYITVSVTTTIALIVLTSGTASTNSVGGLINAPWATIEVFSNNNAIMPFTGATSSTSGIVGYIPAPPAGTQNSYLRGDGTWQQANNAPTAAQYCYAVQTVATATYNTGNFFQYAVPATIAGSAITQTSATQFTLQVGYTYKCTADLCHFAGGAINYKWYNVTTSTMFGSLAQGLQNQSPTALGYITPTVTTVIGLYITDAVGVEVKGTNVDFRGTRAWATIEVVSNNNTITQFAGATGSAAGSIGYIPAPAVGQQNHYLTGAGSWAPPPSLTGTGSIQQAINSTTSAYYSYNSNWTSVPGLTLTLTPNSTASQFLLRASITYGLDLPGAVLFRFMRGSTPIGLNSASSGLVGSFRSFIGSATNYANTASGDYLDAPATTSSITYSVQCITFSTVKIMFNASVGGQAGTVDPSGAISTLTITQC